MEKILSPLSYNLLEYLNNPELVNTAFSLLRKKSKLSESEQVLMATIALFSGDMKTSKEKMFDLDHCFENKLNKIKNLVVHSVFSCQMYEYEKFFKYADEIELLLKEINNEEGKALIQMNNRHKAIVFSNTGKHYRAMDLMQEQLDNKSGVKALTNASSYDLIILFMQFGQYDNIERYLKFVPKERDVYIKLCIEQVNGKFDLGKEMIRSGFPLSLSHGVYNRVLERVFLSVLVLGDKQLAQAFKGGPLWEFMIKSPPHTDWPKKCLELTKVYFGEQNWESVKNISANPSWHPHDQLWFNHKKMLVYSSLFPRESFLVECMDEINQLCERYRFLDPVFPSFENNQWYPESVWGSKLSAKLRISKTFTPSRKVIIRGSDICYFDGEKMIKVDFSKAHKSLKAMRALAGIAGSSRDKKDIHEQITIGMYNKDLHENRLHQLYRRIHKKLTQEGFPKVFSFSGDNRILLTIGIFVE